MEEVKKTRKKPVANQDVQKTDDSATVELEKAAPEASATSEPTAEKPIKKSPTKKPTKSTSSKQKAEKVDSETAELENTAPEVAATSEPVADDVVKQSAAEKQVKKSTTKKSTKSASSEKQAEQNDKPKTEELSEAADQSKTEEQSKADDQSEQGEQPNVDEPSEKNEQSKVDEQSTQKTEAEEDESVAVVQDSAEAELKPTVTKKKKVIAAETDKKSTLNKKLIIILSCVLVAVIVAIVLAVTLTSCNSDGKTVKRYTVTFDTMGGSEIASVTLNEGEKIARPTTNPTKEMFTFDDWYIINPNNPSEKQKFVFDTTISQNITIIAGWLGETSVKVEFNANGGAFENNKEVVIYGLIGSAMVAPTDVPTRTGYKFNGWYQDESCSSKYIFGAFPTDNVTLYAGWANDAEYGYVSYYGNGELLRVEPVKKTDNVTFPDLFNDSDIVVGNWYIDAEMTKTYTVGKPLDSLNLYTTYYTKGLTFSRGTVTGYNGTATSIVVPTKYNNTSITSIGADAFYRSHELPAITSVKLPDTIRTIGNDAFYDCQYLASINLTANVLSIGENAFYRNIRLRTIGDISGVRTIGNGAFDGCKDLRDFEFGNSLLSIGDYAFNDCVLLTNVTLTGSVQSVGEYAFSGCTSLKTVTAESLVLESIGNNAFAGCTSLTEITLKKESAVVEFGGNPVTDSRNVTIYVPSALLDAYKDNNNNAQFKDKFAAIR